MPLPSQARYVVSCAALLLMILVPVVTFEMLFDKPTSSPETDVASDVPLNTQPLDVDTSMNVDTLQPFPQEGQPHGVAPTRAWTDGKAN